jgi:hypothetical protein
VGTFWATTTQSGVVLIALIVAYVQYRASINDGRVRLTLDTFRELTSSDVCEAIDRVSGDMNYEADWPKLRAALGKVDEEDPERLQCEQDLFTIANMFSKIWRLYERRLISREIYHEEFDEYTLFVCGAVSGVYETYGQPDYRGLFKLADSCQKNYVRRDGRYKRLRTLKIPHDGSGAMPSNITPPIVPGEPAALGKDVTP